MQVNVFYFYYQTYLQEYPLEVNGMGTPQSGIRSRSKRAPPSPEADLRIRKTPITSTTKRKAAKADEDREIALKKAKDQLLAREEQLKSYESEIKTNQATIKKK